MKLKNTLLLTSTLVAFDNAGWKTNEDGSIAAKDGNPVFVNSAGQEMTMDQNAITKLNGEAKAHREAKEEALKALQVYDGLDAEAARKAIDTVSKMNAKELIDAGKVDEVKEQITQQFQSQVVEKDNLIAQLQSQMDDMKVTNIFANSEFVRNDVAIPADMFEAYFRKNFSVEDGEIIVKSNDGNRLMSKENIGQPATPSEGLRMLVETHPQKDIILRADVGTGSGSNGGGGNRGGGRVIKRSDFDQMAPAKKAEVAGKVRAGEMTLTD